MTSTFILILHKEFRIYDGEVSVASELYIMILNGNNQ